MAKTAVENVQPHTGSVLFMLVAIFMIYLNNSGKLGKLKDLFKSETPAVTTDDGLDLSLRPARVGGSPSGGYTGYPTTGTGGGNGSGLPNGNIGPGGSYHPPFTKVTN